jgi:integrase
MVAMTSLKKAKNGDWFSRKAIPADIRDAYLKAYGVSREERFRKPSSFPHMQAVSEFRDWDALVSSRIDQLRSAVSGRTIDLTQRQISALCGEWYGWFTGLHEDEPGEAAAWDSHHEALLKVYSKFDVARDHPEEDAPLTPLVQRHVDAKVQEIGNVVTFLAEKNMRLSEATLAVFMRSLEVELIAALALLRRRSGGDYSADTRVMKFANSAVLVANQDVKLTGLDSWQAFEAWVKERKPASSTVNRWRTVFLHLNDHFEKRDAATITEDDAVAWKGTLVTTDRSAAVSNEVWLRAAITVFNWLKSNKKIKINPFDGLRVATSKKPKRREREFQTDEWQAILKATLAPPVARMKAQKAASRRWVPWLCAYTGSRAGEMTQLQGSSVYQQDGVWLIAITPEDGTVKGASFRKVPIHEHLIAQGFLDFVEAAGKGPLFYDPNDRRADGTDPTKPPQPPYVITRNKLAEWVREGVGVKDKDISPNHAWRHTFKRKAARAGLEKRFRFAFCGHEDGDVGDQYETPTLEDMAEALKKFPRYDLD